MSDGDLLRVDIDNGKYTFVQPKDSGAYILRYGEEWLDELPYGANCYVAMAYEIDELRREVARLVKVAKDV